MEPKGGSYDLGGALRTWQWYAIWAMFFLYTTVGLAVYSDAKAMAGSISGASAAAASVFVVISLADTAVRLVWPVLSDRIGAAQVPLWVAYFVARLAMPNVPIVVRHQPCQVEALAVACGIRHVPEHWAM